MLQGGYPMSAKTPIGSNLKLFRAKKKLLKDFITNDPYLSGELGNYKHGTLFSSSRSLATSSSAVNRGKDSSIIG